MNISLNSIALLNRGRKKYEKVEELAQSLLLNGQLQNIIVRKPNADEELADGEQWVLVVGGRRYAAALKAGLAELRAEVLDELPAWRQRTVELEENVQRQDMHWSEIVEMKLQIQELYEAHDPNWRQADTAKLLGVTPGHVSRDINLAKEMRADKTLKEAKSRVTAIRKVKLRQAVANQISSVEGADIKSIRQLVRNEDARELMARIPDRSVDLLFTDLPWGIDFYEASGSGSTSKYDDSHATSKQLIDDLVPEFVRTVKNTGWIVIIMNWEFHEYIRHLLNGYCGVHRAPLIDEKRCAADDGCKPLLCEPISWLWYRPNAANRSKAPEVHASNDYELILVCNVGGGLIHTSNVERVGNVLMYDAEYSERIHSMQKPEDLCDEIILRLTLSNNLVVDPCCGSGAIPRSAAKLGRRFLGSETNPETHEAAIAYISQTYKGKAMSNPLDNDSVIPPEENGPYIPDEVEDEDDMEELSEELDEMEEEDEYDEDELTNDDEDEDE